MTVPKNDKFKDYARYAEHCLNMVAATTDQRIAFHSTRNGRRMAKTSGYSSAPSQVQANANGMIQAASVGGRRSDRYCR